MCKELTIVIRWLSNKILLVFLWPHLVWAFRPSAHHPLRTHKEISKMLLAYQLLSSSALSCGHFSSATQIIRASKVDKDGFCSGYLCIVFVVQSLTHVWLFETLWTTACQILLAWTIFQCLLRFMSIESVMLSNHLILFHPLLLLSSVFPSFRVFPMSQLFPSGDWSIRASATLLAVNIQSWFPLGLTGWSPYSPRDSARLPTAS